MSVSDHGIIPIYGGLKLKRSPYKSQTAKYRLILSVHGFGLSLTGTFLRLIMSHIRPWGEQRILICIFKLPPSILVRVINSIYEPVLQTYQHDSAKLATSSSLFAPVSSWLHCQK